MFSANVEWLMAVERILAQGAIVSPRGQKTFEILGNQTAISMQEPVVTLIERNINLKFLFGEAWWILSGSNRVTDIAPYMNAIKQFSDNGISFRGAYGPQIIEQLDYVIDSLSNDEYSRQAILTIWRQNPRPSKDIPCTVSMQWFIRDGRLDCSVYMRSSDMFLGWVYDVFNFSCVSAYIAIALRLFHYPDLQLGRLILTAGSQHIYERNVEDVKRCLNTEDKVNSFPFEIFNLGLYSHPEQFVDELKRRAENARQQR